MSRKLLARVMDLHDQPVGPASGTVLQASAFDTLQDIYGRAGVDDRAVVSCRTLAHRRSALERFNSRGGQTQTLASTR